MARVTVEDCILKVENRFELVLIASHMDKYTTALTENIRKTWECDVIFDKQMPNTRRGFV